METTIVYWGYIGIMEKKMETTIVYWGFIWIMEKKMETIIYNGIILGLYLPTVKVIGKSKDSQ